MTIKSSPRYDSQSVPSILKQAATKANTFCGTTGATGYSGPTGFTIQATDADKNRWGVITGKLAQVCNGLTGPTGQDRPLNTNPDMEWSDSGDKNSVGYVLKQCVDTLNLH
jgi:hypothetical protein